MSMKKLVEAVQQLVEEEYKRAASEYGPVHASQHEAFAVMREEFQEAVEELNTVGEGIEEHYWHNARKDDRQANIGVAEGIKAHAVYAACECIQTAAMALKSQISFDKEDGNA